MGADGQARRVLDGVLYNEVDQRVDVVRVERRLANEELVQDDPQRPQVGGVVVPAQ